MLTILCRSGRQLHRGPDAAGDGPGGGLVLAAGRHGGQVAARLLRSEYARSAARHRRVRAARQVSLLYSALLYSTLLYQ